MLIRKDSAETITPALSRREKERTRLHHTNIVPIFAVGEHDGLPYYAMQYIPEGEGLMR